MQQDFGLHPPRRHSLLNLSLFLLIKYRWYGFTVAQIPGKIGRAQNYLYQDEKMVALKRIDSKGFQNNMPLHFHDSDSLLVSTSANLPSSRPAWTA